MASIVKECVHGDDFYLCIPCQNLERTPISVPESFGASTNAKFPGYCRRCEDKIAVGDRICAAESGWIHTKCR